MALMTAAEVRSKYIIGLSGTGEDTEIDEFVLLFDELAARYCFFPPATPGGAPTLEDVTYTEFLDGPTVDDPTILQLPVQPVLSITTAETDSAGDWTYATAIGSGDRTLDGERGWLYMNPGSSEAWLSGRRANKVVYVAGFSTIGVLKQACGAQVANWWRMRKERGKTSASSRGSNKNLLPETLSAEVKQVLSSFRLVANSVG